MLFFLRGGTAPSGGAAEPEEWLHILATVISTQPDYAGKIKADGDGNTYASGNVYEASGYYVSSIYKHDRYGYIALTSGLHYAANYTRPAVEKAAGAYVAGASGVTYECRANRTTGVSGTIDLLITALTAAGAVNWTARAYNASGPFAATDICMAGTNAVVAAEYGTGILLIAYNSSGTKQWDRLLSSSYSHDYPAICADSSGNVYVSCMTADTSQSNVVGVALAKYNSSGTIQWQRKLHQSTTAAMAHYGNGIDTSGNVFIAGTTTDTTIKGVLVKYNSSGTIQWQRMLNSGSSSTYLRGVCADSSGNSYVCGDYVNGSYSETIIAKYNSSGAIQWQCKLYNAGYSVTARDIAIDSYGYLRVLGAANGHLWVMRVPSDGTMTGTYGPFTYATSSLTEGAASLTDAAGIQSDASNSLFTTTTGTTTYGVRGYRYEVA